MSSVYLKSVDPEVVAYVREQERLYREFSDKVRAFEDDHPGAHVGVQRNPFSNEAFAGGLKTEHPELLPGRWRKSTRNGFVEPYRNNTEGNALLEPMHFKASEYPGVVPWTFYGYFCMITQAFVHDETAWAMVGAQTMDGSPSHDDRWDEIECWVFEKAKAEQG